MKAAAVSSSSVNASSRSSGSALARFCARAIEVARRSVFSKPSENVMDIRVSGLALAVVCSSAIKVQRASLRPPPDQERLHAFEHQFAALVEHGAAQADDTGRTSRAQLGDLERRVDGIAGIDRLEELARLFEEADQRVLDQEWKQAGTGRGMDQGLESVGEQIGHAAGAAIFDVVVNGVGVAARGLERRKHRRCHGAARQHEAFAEDKILEPALLGYHTMIGGVELGHGGSWLLFL